MHQLPSRCGLGDRSGLERRTFALKSRTIVINRSSAEFRAMRKPLLFVRFVGSFVLRFAVRQFAASLFQLPPRFTRFVPLRIVHH